MDKNCVVQNCVVLGYPELERLLPKRGVDSRWFLLMVKLFGLDVVLWRERDGLVTAGLRSADGRFLSPMSGNALRLGVGTYPGEAVAGLLWHTLRAREVQGNSFSERMFRLSKLGTRSLFEDGCVADMECPMECTREMEMKVALRGL